MPSVHCISRKLLKKNGLECLPWDIGSAPTEQQQTSVDAPTDLQLQHAQHLGGEDSIHQCIQELDTEMSDTIDRNQKLGSIVVDSSTTQQPQPHQECLHTSAIPTKSVEEAIDNELNEFRTSKKKKKTKHMSPIALRALAALNSDSDSSSGEEDMDIDKPAQKGLDAAEIENLATGGKDEVGEDTSSSRDTQIMIPSLPPLPVVPSPGYNVADDTAQHIPHVYSLSDGEEDLKSTKEPAKKRRRTIETSGGNKKSTKVSFQQRLDELKAYKDEHGHMNVKKSENKSLYDFCVSIRSARKNPSDNRVRVTKERIESLDALGFEWVQKIKDTSFEQRLDDLKVYKMKHGHLSLKRSDDPGLYDFCAGMRAARKTAGKSGMRKLTKERIASLDILGFEWVVRENANISFKQRLEDLTAYKLKYGHLNMKRSDNTSLYNFCVSIRAARKNPSNNRVRVTKERIESLDAIGFDWDPRKQSSG